MTFSEALEAIKRGYKVTRKIWKNTYKYLGYNAKEGVLFSERSNRCDILSTESILATDWEICNEPKPEPKFEIGELVMMRDFDDHKWKPKHFSHCIADGEYPFVSIDNSIYRQCTKFDKDIVFTCKPAKQ